MTLQDYKAEPFNLSLYGWKKAYYVNELQQQLEGLEHETDARMAECDSARLKTT